MLTSTLLAISTFLIMHLICTPPPPPPPPPPPKQQRFFHMSIINSIPAEWPSLLPPPPTTPKKKKIFGNLCFSFLLGITGVPREIENNAYAKFGEQIRCIMGDVEVAYELLNVKWLNKYDWFVKLAPSFLCSFNWLTRRWVEKIILPLARS